MYAVWQFCYDGPASPIRVGIEFIYMKVILLRDVAKIGRRFEVKEVPAGHAHNFLIPRKLAEPATAESLRRLAVELKKKTVLNERHDTDFKSTLETLAGAPIELILPANAQGHLFKGVHASDIVKAAMTHGVHMSESDVALDHPIKETGEHTVALRRGDTEGTVVVRITGA